MTSGAVAQGRQLVGIQALHRLTSQQVALAGLAAFILGQVAQLHEAWARFLHDRIDLFQLVGQELLAPHQAVGVGEPGHCHIGDHVLRVERGLAQLLHAALEVAAGECIHREAHHLAHAHARPVRLVDGGLHLHAQ